MLKLLGRVTSCVLLTVAMVGGVAPPTAAQEVGSVNPGGWAMGPSSVSFDVYGSTDITDFNVYRRLRTEEVSANTLVNCQWTLNGGILNCTLHGLAVGDHYLTVAQPSATGTWRSGGTSSPPPRPVTYGYRVTADGSECCIEFGTEPMVEKPTNVRAQQTGVDSLLVTWEPPPGLTRPTLYIVVMNGNPQVCWTTGLQCEVTGVTDFTRDALVGGTPNLSNLASAPMEPLPQLATAASVNEIVRSLDYQPETHGDILRLYRAFFDREPDVKGARYWFSIRKTHGLTAISEFFTGSEEFSTKYAGFDNAEFLGRIYRNVLGRNFDQGGFDYWLDFLQGTNRTGGNATLRTLTRGEVVRWVAASAELRNRFPYR